MVERANGFLETSFLPGRRFASVADFDAQLAEWIATRANTRPRRALDGAAPVDRIGADKAAMRALPPIEAASIGWRHSVRLPRDHYVRWMGISHPISVRSWVISSSGRSAPVLR
jgi:hypothetical protein